MTSHRLAGWLFLRLLGVVYLLAFLSLWLQIDGLFGPRGILPVAPFLDRVVESLGGERFLALPTLCWLGGGGAFLHVLCAAGVVLALAVILGYVQTPALFGLWLAYLSLASVGRELLSFQWDALLLETGLLAVFLVPPRWRVPLATAEPPFPLPLWLLRWLTFRLFFASGTVKLASGDATWRDLSALAFHHETQPLPTPAGWYLHQLPLAFHRASTALVLAVEIAVPFLLFAPVRFRRPAVWTLIALQVLIALSGNYGFFNLLTIALCLLALDDAAWPLRRLKRPALDTERASPPRPRWQSWAAAPLAMVVLVLTPFELLSAAGVRAGWPGPVEGLYRLTAPFRSINSYGLFAVMTTERPEIVIEGSEDGVTWKPYELRWKAGDPARAPAWVAPHMPRLDWQMWFAALGPLRDSPWFPGLLGRLAEGSPAVTGLLAANPFPDHPPRFLRATVWRYRFSTWSERRATGAWWVREIRGPFFPEVESTALRGFLERAAAGATH